MITYLIIPLIWAIEIVDIFPFLKQFICEHLYVEILVCIFVYFRF